MKGIASCLTTDRIKVQVYIILNMHHHTLLQQCKSSTNCCCVAIKTLLVDGAAAERHILVMGTACMREYNEAHKAKKVIKFLINPQNL